MHGLLNAAHNTGLIHQKTLQMQCRSQRTVHARLVVTCIPKNLGGIKQTQRKFQLALRRYGLLKNLQHSFKAQHPAIIKVVQRLL